VRRMITIFALAVLAVAMMGAEDPGCDKAKGRQPAPAQQPPAPKADPHPTEPDKLYRFQVSFDTLPAQHVRYSHTFGDSTKTGERNDDSKYTTGGGRRVRAGEDVKLKVTVIGGGKTILQCYILYIPDDNPKQPKVRYHYIDDRAPYICEAKWKVQPNEDDIPSLG
jgi:hypothetical protein